MLSLRGLWVGRVHGLGQAVYLFLGCMMEQRQKAQGEPASKPKTYLLLALRVNANQKPVVLIDVSYADLMNIHGEHFRGASQGMI